MGKHDNKNKTGIIFGAVIAALAVAVIIIAMLLVESYKIREFKVDVFVLCNESDICVADSPEGKIKIHQDNLPAIYSILQKSHGRTVSGNPEPLRSLSLEFDCHDETNNMIIDEINEDILRISLLGSENKTMYFSNKGAYNEYAKAVSLKGYNTANKPIGK
jgi:hypothetical protein